MQKIRILSTFAVLMFAFALAARPVLAGAAGDDADWPCDQRLVPMISLATVWQGPPLDDLANTWWENEAAFQLVDQLMDPTLTEEEGVAIIDGFTGNHDGDRKDLLIKTFAGLFQKMNAERTRQIKGIKNFFKRQEKLTEKILEVSEKIRELKKTGADSQDPRMKELDEEIFWNTRVYDEREKLTVYICEEPILLEQRLGTLARTIQDRLK